VTSTVLRIHRRRRARVVATRRAARPRTARAESSVEVLVSDSVAWSSPRRLPRYIAGSSLPTRLDGVTAPSDRVGLPSRIGSKGLSQMAKSTSPGDVRIRPWGIS
jgi:hypothetical protein